MHAVGIKVGAASVAHLDAHVPISPGIMDWQKCWPLTVGCRQASCKRAPQCGRLLWTCVQLSACSPGTDTSRVLKQWGQY